MNTVNIKKVSDLRGEEIHGIFAHAEEIAGMHSALTSSRGDYFKKRLLSKLSKPLEEKMVREFAEKSGIKDYKRHVHQLVKCGFVEQKSSSDKMWYTYRRTYNGEEAMAFVSKLERKFGTGRVKDLFKASLGINSTRLFLKVYSSTPKAFNGEKDIVYSPLEIGQMTSFLPRTIEGISASDKLDGGGLVSYMEDGNVHVNPRRSTAFYQYLKGLYSLLPR
ncbi:MAG: hypothetical protein ACI9QC_000244 [Oceanicoccus sp.]|jgi:hypothetical protein